ncbi:MAG: hypothetical protein ABGY24_08210 [bacterium]
MDVIHGVARTRAIDAVDAVDAVFHERRSRPSLSGSSVRPAAWVH